MASSAQYNLSGQRAVVTGSSSGIGRAIALGFAAAGADLVIHANRSGEAAEKVAAKVHAMGRTAEVLLCDLSDLADCRSLVHQCWDQRPVDIWVNNAGADILTGEAVELSFDEKLAMLWKVDVRATICLAREAGQRMKGQGSGVMLNMGWDQATTGMSGDSGEMFAATKGAIMSFSSSLAKSLAPEVRVNCLAPGWIQTQWGDQAPEYWQERATGESLLGRWGTAEDVAQMACYLVSPAANFITGQTLNINGGTNR